HRVRPCDGRAYDHALVPCHAGLRAELRVAALDKLSEQRTVKTRADGVWSRPELAGMAVERLACPLVILADVHHERGRGAVVDEVVANPLDLPGFPEGAAGAVLPEAAVEHGFGDHRA